MFQIFFNRKEENETQEMKQNPQKWVVITFDVFW